MTSSPEVRGTSTRYHSTLCEPWDGPAGVDLQRTARSWARRSTATGCARSAMRSEAISSSARRRQAWLILPEGPVRRGRLGPGEMIAIDSERGLEENRALKRRLAARAPYGEWLEGGLVRGSCGSPVGAPETDLTPRQAAFGYTQEDLRAILRPTASHAHEPTSSMGDDTALAPLAGRARPLYSYFRQRFAQVTNPPIDHLRERFVFSLRTLLGGRSPILVEDPEAAGGIELPSFLLFPDGVERLDTERLDATFAPGEGLEPALDRILAEAEAAVRAGRGMLLLSDTAAGLDRAPVPMLLAVGAVHDRLVAEELRTFATLVVESDEPREVHHVACLLGYGAEAICPRLALETVAALAAGDKLGGDRPSPEEAQERFCRAIEDGVLKVMSKMGIATLDAYCGAQIFEALGVSEELLHECFAGTDNFRLGGVSYDDWRAMCSNGIARASPGRMGRSTSQSWTATASTKAGEGGEQHAFSPEVVEALLHAVVGLGKADGARRRYEAICEAGRGPASRSSSATSH